jgi:peptidoglycan/xylan/chitin deacetylase (PgdA/CDA1 family)
MRLLHAHGFHAITQAQLLAALEHGAPLPRRGVMITLDDGYRDVLWDAAPTLVRLGMPATEYVITGRIFGPDPSFLTWPELHALEAQGIEIGSHTVHHAALPLLSATVARRELVDSRRALERHLGHPVPWFAYPYGAEDARVIPLVREAGYALAITTHSGATQSSSAPLELHRYEVLDTTTAADLLTLVGG